MTNPTTIGWSAGILQKFQEISATKFNRQINVML